MAPAPEPRHEPPADPAELGEWIADLVLAEAETRVLALLAENGFPTDLTRAPTPAEVASRTAYAQIEADHEAGTVEVVAALLAARAALLASLEAVLAGAVTVAEVLRRLDLTVAGVLTIPGARDVVTDLQALLRRILAGIARRAAVRLVADAHRARITPTDPRPVDDLLDVDGTRGTGPAGAPPAAEVLELQATRLAAETVDRGVRDVRDVAHRVAAATGAAVTPTASGAASPAGVVPVEVASRFVSLVLADARDTPMARGSRDSAHQGVLAAAGAGRVAAAAAYRRPSETASAERDIGREGSGADVTPPPNGTGRPFDPADPDRDPTRTPDPGFVPEAGARFYSSELLDRATCSPCAAVDGTEYATYADALLDYPLGQYRLCEGGTRCRGTVVMVSARENPATLRTPGDGRGTSPA